mmetsp:Transcript_61926/g.113196  ORF Transcript_61926/g.113196 Transcript_61926/m.113196 type:complete len:230 (-) Transcript_61926:988-1677(-)
MMTRRSRMLRNDQRSSCKTGYWKMSRLLDRRDRPLLLQPQRQPRRSRQCSLRKTATPMQRARRLARPRLRIGAADAQVAGQVGLLLQSHSQLLREVPRAHNLLLLKLLATLNLHPPHRGQQRPDSRLSVLAELLTYPPRRQRRSRIPQCRRAAVSVLLAPFHQGRELQTPATHGKAKGDLRVVLQSALVGTCSRSGDGLKLKGRLQKLRQRTSVRHQAKLTQPPRIRSS